LLAKDGSNWRRRGSINGALIVDGLVFFLIALAYLIILGPVAEKFGKP